MLLLTVAVAPGLFWLWYFLRRDQLLPEPRSLVRRVFFLGAAAGLVAAGMELVALAHSLLDISLDVGDERLLRVLAVAGIVGVVEETAKFLAVFGGAYFHHEFNEVFDGIVYGVAAAMGFATLENIGYVLQGGVGVGLIRAVLSVPGHAFFASLMGFHLGKAKFAGARAPWWIASGILLAALAHGLFNAVLLTETAAATLVIPLVIALWRGTLIRSHRARELDGRRYPVSSTPPNRQRPGR